MNALLDKLRSQAQTAEQLHAQSRQLLTTAVREGIKAGLSQREIALAIGRSQPEISRLLRFHGSSRLGMLVRKHRAEILKIFTKHEVTNVRIFGSVVHSLDTENSDIDFLVTIPMSMSLFDLAELDIELTSLLGVEVEVTPDRSLRPFLRDRVLGEAVPL